MSSQRNARSGLSFFGMLGAVMAVLKLKQSWDEYKPVSTHGDEGRVALTSPAMYRSPDDEDSIGLLDTEIPVTRPKRKRSNCCICCGVNCSLFWKAFAIVLSVLAVWNAFKLIRWAITDTPTGLELMPAYSTSLGCLSAPYIYNSSKTVFSARIGPQDSDHTFDIRGSAVGTFIIAQGSPESREVIYEMTLRTDDPALLRDVAVHYPDTDDDDGVINSRLVISTPRTDTSSPSCMRYDITMFVPPTLKKLHVAAHATTHFQFDPDSHIELDDFYVTLFAMSTNNMILPHEGFRSKRMALEVYRGWIVGDVGIVNSTSITTQRGDGVVNVRAHPTAPLDSALPDPVSLRTTTGAGRTDIFYINSKGFKRPIHNVHMSSRNADMYLTYREAEYNGLIELDAGSYTATGVQPIPKSRPDVDEGEDDGRPKWTHWAGNKDGEDILYVQSRGWAGLYF